MMQLRLRPVPRMIGPALETGVMACVAVLGWWWWWRACWSMGAEILLWREVRWFPGR